MGMLVNGHVIRLVIDSPSCMSGDKIVDMWNNMNKDNLRPGMDVEVGVEGDGPWIVTFQVGVTKKKDLSLDPEERGWYSVSVHDWEDVLVPCL